MAVVLQVHPSVRLLFISVFAYPPRYPCSKILLAAAMSVTRSHRRMGQGELGGTKPADGPGGTGGNKTGRRKVKTLTVPTALTTNYVCFFAFLSWNPEDLSPNTGLEDSVCNRFPTLVVPVYVHTIMSAAGVSRHSTSRCIPTSGTSIMNRKPLLWLKVILTRNS